VLAATAAGMAGCRPGKGPPPAPPPPAVTVVKPVLYPVQSYLEYNGYLEAIETVQVKARVKGFLNKVLFTEGEEVTAGQPLYQIDPREYQADLAKAEADILKAVADIANAKAQVKLGEAEETRQQEAYKKGAGPKTDLDKAVAALAASRAGVEVAAAQKAAAEAAKQTAELQLGYTDIRSPIAGRISRTLVTQGNLVGQGEPTLLTTVVSVDPLYVYFDAPERDLVEYQKAQQERPDLPAPTSRKIPVEVGVATEEGYPHVGEIDFRENRVDVGSGTIRVRGRVPNPGVGRETGPVSAPVRLLYPGLYARVRLPVGGPVVRPVIPESALQSGQEGRYVFVVGPDNKVVKKVVTVGTRIYREPPGENPGPPAWTLTNPDPKPPPPSPGPAPPAPPPPATVPVGSVVAIDKGLGPDDRVIVDGIQKTRPGAEVVPEEWRFAGPPPPKTGGPQVLPAGKADRPAAGDGKK
ncbi:MAG: efflux RND transporter periplasmic adaptor subunit, partial [Gemmataceae bacterium]|nr:efflux RND transporter periplasmic adaptor subunit [Gemmataceae bacterium]